MPALDYGDGMIFACLDDLTAHLGVPVPTLRRWATEDGWPMRKLRGRNYYLLSKAQESYANRGRARRDTQKRGA